jgi:hypothetical protein
MQRKIVINYNSYRISEEQMILFSKLKILKTTQ